MRIELSEVMEDLPYIVAAVGAVTHPLNVELYEKLYDSLTASEIVRLHKLEREMSFKAND